MGRARRGNRRGRKNNSGNSPDAFIGQTSDLDRDDDLFMYGAEERDRRGKRNYNNQNPNRNQNQNRNNNNRRGGRGQNRGRGRNDYKAAIENPFHQQANIDSLDYTTPSPPQGPRFQGRRNRNRNRGKGNSRDQIPAPDNDNDDLPYVQQPQCQHHQRQHYRQSSTLTTSDIYPPVSFPTHTHSHNQDLTPQPPSTRFCTECSAVRRANLTLRDWLLSAFGHATAVIDSWSDEVGVSRGTADEMDWQPEPVVRVLILTTTKADEWTEGTKIGSGVGDDAYDVYATPEPGLCTRPNSLSPGFGDWGAGGSTGLGILGQGTSEDSEGNEQQQVQMTAVGSDWREGGFEQKLPGMVSPPESPRSVRTKQWM